MDIHIIEKEAMNVVGIASNGTYDQMDKIPGWFAEMEFRSEEVSFRTEKNIFIALVHRRETEFTYYVTVPVETIAFIPEGMVGFAIPRKTYVRAAHYGMNKENNHTYNKTLSWMKEYGYEQDQQALSLEIYQEEYNQVYFEIYIPVKKY